MFGTNGTGNNGMVQMEK